MTLCMIVVTCPTRKVAEATARRLVEDRLAACGTVTAPATSLYRWNGKVHRDAEVLLFLKTRRGLVNACAAAIRELHPYEVPEVLALPVVGGLPEYLRWVGQETRAPRRSGAGRGRSTRR